MLFCLYNRSRELALRLHPATRKEEKYAYKYARIVILEDLGGAELLPLAEILPRRSEALSLIARISLLIRSYSVTQDCGHSCENESTYRRDVGTQKKLHAYTKRYGAAQH